MGTLADARLLYSEAVAEDIRTRSAKPDSVFVAPNAIDQEQVRVASDRWRDSSKLDDFRVKVGLAGTNLFVALSRLRPEKKLSDLIRAVASLRSEGRAVHLAVIGDGIEMASLEELAVSLGIADCVQFLGGLYDEEELAPWCLSAVACVVPASIGLSLLHAFGYALPVITTSDEQTPEIEALRNGENGILVKSQGVDGLVSAMRSLLDDSGTRGRMATAAAATVGEDGFGIPQMVDGMIQAIRYAARVRRSGL
ncbi:MAG TPA: glycosyltransferase family 4 protein [Mycobacterium sp.]|nr:glycosyltransferase family 4 protein [Mycobacterium sp.]